MTTQEYLSLKLIRLKATEEWAQEANGLSFAFPRGGTGMYLSGSLAQPLFPGDVLILNGTLRGRVCVTDGAELLLWAFSVGVEHLFPLLGCEEISLLQGVTDSLKSIRTYPASSPVALECHKLLADVPARSDLSHRGQLLRVAATILSAEFKNVRPQRERFVTIDEHIKQVFEKLSMAEILHLSIDDLAARFSCSRRHLNRLFHHHFGFSVASLRMEMRLLKAVSLLRDPTAKIITVAEQCGFNHLGLFNTCFKRRFGASPGQWRKGSDQELPPSPSYTDDFCRLRTNGLCPWAGRDVGMHPSFPEKLPIIGIPPSCNPLKSGNHHENGAKKANGNGKAARKNEFLNRPVDSAVHAKTQSRPRL